MLGMCPGTTAPSPGVADLRPPPFPAPHSLLRAITHRPDWLAPVSPHGWDGCCHSHIPSCRASHRRGTTARGQASSWVGQQQPWEPRADGELKNSSLTQLDEEPIPRDLA